MSHAVGVKTFTFEDKSRNRTLETEVFYPIDDKTPATSNQNIWIRNPEARNAPIKAEPAKFPLIVMSHGDSGSRLDSTWILEYLAANGYIVTALDHFGNTWYQNLPLDTLKRWDRPKDISFVLDELLKDPFFGKRIDPERIGFMGFSVGGFTGIWIAGGIASTYSKPSLHSSPVYEYPADMDQALVDSVDYSEAKKSYRDPRVKSAFIMAPGYGNAFDAKGLEAIQIPVYIIAGESDEVVNVEKNAMHLGKNIKGSQLEILPGKVGHFVFLNIPTEMGKKFIKPKFIQDDPSIDRKAIHDIIEKRALEFFNKTLRSP